MSERRLASIVVNNFNYRRFLREAVDSALAQSYPHTEVIVVDDGSTDGSWEIIQTYGDRVKGLRQENGGQASAFNTGFAHSRGDVLLFLDADDVLLPTAVEHALAALGPTDAKVHWPLWVIDSDARRTGTLLPTAPLPEGELRDVLVDLGPDSYQTSPTSGNAWSRHFLRQVLPAPEPEYRQGADGYLLNLAPWFGPIRRLAGPEGCYRVHGGNQFWCAALDERTERSLVRYDRRCRTLVDFLRRRGVHADEAAWKQRNPYYHWLSRLRDATAALTAAIPPDASFILVDDDQWGGQPLTGRRALPFLEKDGVYWGPPPDDAAAIEECRRFRSEGAAFIAFAWPAFWWLDHYAGFRDFLTTRFRCLIRNDDVVLFDLRSAESPKGEVA
jgi:glycosyltransferase involved in cell wall biosynthesis